MTSSNAGDAQALDLPAAQRLVAAGEIPRPSSWLLENADFTVDQAAHGHPKNPAFLLEHGELPRLVAPLEVLRERDGEFEGARVAGSSRRGRVKLGLRRNAYIVGPEPAQE